MKDSFVPVLLPDAEAPEWVRCQHVADDRYIICDVPVFSAYFGFADLISASLVEDTLVAQQVLDSRLWSTYALEPKGEMFADAALLLLKEIERYGCPVQLRAGRIASIAVPLDSAKTVREILEDGVLRGFWYANLIHDAHVELVS
jgi:hypothetical protein